MSTLSKIGRHTKRALTSLFTRTSSTVGTAATATSNIAVATGSVAKRAVVSRATVWFLLGVLVGFIGPKYLQGYNIPIPRIVWDTNKPEAKPDTPKVETSAVDEKVDPPECTETRKTGERFVDRPSYVRQYGHDGTYASRQVMTKAKIPVYGKVQVPCQNLPPAGTIMYGFKGLSGLFDTDAFKAFAKARGYVPVVISEWPSRSAEDEFNDKLKKGAPYALYGFSLGGQTVRNIASNNLDNPPLLAVTVGASSGVVMKDKFSPKTKVEHYFHTGTNHDVDGVYIEAPHLDEGNIQEVVAKKYGSPNSNLVATKTK